MQTRAMLQQDRLGLRRAIVLALTAVLAWVGLMVAAVPTQAFALDVSVLSEGANTSEAKTVIFGGKAWQVIGYDGVGVAQSAGSGTMTLLLDGTSLSSSAYDASGTTNHYAGSTLQSATAGIYDSFNDDEKLAVVPRDLEGGETFTGYRDAVSDESTVAAQPLWPLSLKEAFIVLDASLRPASQLWWLRTPDTDPKAADYMFKDGYVEQEGVHTLYSRAWVNESHGVRPAFYVNLASVTSVTQRTSGDHAGAYDLALLPAPDDIAGATINGGGKIAGRFYDGTPYEPEPQIKLGDKVLTKDVDYTLSYKNNVYASVSTGKPATVTATGKGDYRGTISAEFQVWKNYQPMTGWPVERKVEWYPLQESAQVVDSPLVLAHVVSLGRPVEYRKQSGAGCLNVDRATGRVTVRKGTKTGAYKIEIRAIAFGGSNYNDGDWMEECTVRVVDSRKGNPLKVSAAAKTASAKTLKTKNVTVASLSVSGAKGKVSYKKASGSDMLTIDASTGKVTVKKGTKAGTYSCKVSVTAAGDATYKSVTKTVTVKVTVK